MGDASVSYSLKYNARVLCAAAADSVNSKWIVGTNALREENEVLVLQHDPDQERLVCTHTYNHAAEVWDLAPCPTSEDLFLTVWSKTGTYGVTLWHASASSPNLQQQAELTGHTGVIRSCLWHGHQHDLVVTVEEGFVKKWAITEAGVECTATAPAGELVQLWSGVLHPRNESVLCTAGGNNVQVWDLRTCAKPSAEIVQAHKMPTRSISFAPHNDTRLVSAGDDCKLRFWDLRMVSKSSESLLDLGGHSHWVWRAAYNPSHDQLIASSSSDSLVNLYYTPQLHASGQAPAGAPGAAPGSDGVGGPAGGNVSSGGATAPTRAGDLDGKAHTFDEHEDSVYGLAWSVSDPWLFASLSYDGRVVVNKVPKNIKYKILI